MSLYVSLAITSYGLSILFFFVASPVSTQIWKFSDGKKYGIWKVTDLNPHIKDKQFTQLLYNKHKIYIHYMSSCCGCLTNTPICSSFTNCCYKVGGEQSSRMVCQGWSGSFPRLKCKFVLTKMGICQDWSVNLSRLRFLNVGVEVFQG